MKTALSLITVLCLLAAGCSKQAPEHRIVVPAGERVRIPLATVNDGGGHFFTYVPDHFFINKKYCTSFDI